MSAKRFNRSSNSVEPTFADASVKLTEAEKEKKALEESLEEKEAELEYKNAQLVEVQNAMSTVTEEKQKIIDAMQSETDALRSKVAELQKTNDDNIKKYGKMEEQLSGAMEVTKNMQIDREREKREIRRYFEDQNRIKQQLDEAMRDLGTTREALRKEREERLRLVEEKERLEATLEDLTEQFAKRQSELSARSTQMIITAVMTACGTATVVSFAFLRYFSVL